MGSASLTHWVVVLSVVLIVFGAGRLPKAMGEFARGIGAFRSGLRDAGATEPNGKEPVATSPAERTR